MQNRSLKTLSVMGGALVVACGIAHANPTPEPEFAPPKRIKAGDAWLGAGRLYPSPVMHDMDGDGKRDVVIGDLFGAVTVAKSLEGDAGLPLAAEAPVMNREGEKLKFHNW